MFASLNIVLYNVFSSQGGPDLYGTEPWYFYLVNGVLNFNLAFVLFLASIPILIVSCLLRKPFDSWRRDYRIFFQLLPPYAWLIFMSLQAHKEERFMYIIFPSICYNSAVALHLTSQLVEWICLQVKWLRPIFKKASQAVVWLCLMIFISLSLLRIYALYQFYHAPMPVYSKLANVPPPGLNSTTWESIKVDYHGNQAIYAQRELKVCVGKEWYRFPSHYFLPHGMKLGFVESGFGGLLPAYFKVLSQESVHIQDYLLKRDMVGYIDAARSATRTLAEPVERVNDLNEPELDRYVLFLT